jgi:hypothetical protein
MSAKLFKIISREGFDIPVGNHVGKKIIIGSDHRGFNLKEGWYLWLGYWHEYCGR